MTTTLSDQVTETPSDEAMAEAGVLTADMIGNLFSVEHVEVIARLVEDRNKWRHLAKVASVELQLSNRADLAIAKECAKRALNR